MDRILARVWPVLLAVVMVALPSLGPLVDHHFAERQPYHRHLGTDRGHDHTSGRSHAHLVDQNVNGGLALYSFEVSSGAPAIALLTDTDLESSLAAGYDSVLDLPGLADAALRSIDVPPPERPPRA